MNFLISIFITGLALFVGIIFFSIVAVLLSAQENETIAQRLESEYAMQKYNRTVRKINLLYEIGKPNLPNGTYSVDKRYLWDVYNRLDEEDECQTAVERENLLSAEGFHVSEQDWRYLEA